MYHKYLPTQPTPSPPVFPYSIGFLPTRLPYRVYPHGYPYSTVLLYSIGFTLSAKVMRFLHKVVRGVDAPFWVVLSF
jgi:hypothetical protein